MKVLMRKTSAEWQEIFSINFIDYKGFPSKEYFNKVKVDKNTFLLYASNCVLSEPVDKSRRAVSDFKQSLFNNKK